MTRHLDDLAEGESAWALPDALGRDAEEKLRVRKDAPCVIKPDEHYRVRLVRTVDGFDADPSQLGGLPIPGLGTPDPGLYFPVNDVTPKAE